MGRIQGLWDYLAARDPALNADRRISRWVNIGAAGTIVNSVGGGIVGALLDYPWAGVAIGLALWFALLYAVVKLNPSSQLSTPSAASTEPKPESATPQPASADDDSPAAGGRVFAPTVSQEVPSEAIERRNEEIVRLKSRGLPMEMVSERHIRYHPHPIRLVDLLDVAGENGAIADFTFEHCILEGPGIITFRGPPPGIETQRGVTATGMVGPTNCRVEGAPDTTLYEINPDGIKRLHGVIQLVGPTIRNVTFRNLGFAGTPDELRSLREHLTFSEGSGSEQPNRPTEASREHQDQRRKRIEGWQASIRDFYSGDTHGYFAATDTYSEMRPHLRPEVIEMLETPRMSTVGNEARGDVAHRSTLLDEIARIEGEWGLI